MTNKRLLSPNRIQLQILITMCLLHVASQDPKALETARSRLPGTPALEASKHTAISSETAAATELDSDQPRKRSRKLEKPKRWRGTRPHIDSNDAFAWNQKARKRMATDSSNDDGENGEGDVLEMQGGEVLTVEHLSKRLEALVDILCLRQVAAGVGSDIADLLSDIGAETMENDKASQTRKKTRGMLLGSSVRKLVEDDDMDDAQWLCSSVVEPHFEASLPRQCSLFRSKCFVSLQSRTPARPIKSVRTGSSGSPPMRAPKRSSSVAPGGLPSASATAGGLSDVLEKEQAGRRVKRTIMAERSSMLGRRREVDMGRRLSRSVSATSGPAQEMRAPVGVFSRSITNTVFTQPVSSAIGKVPHSRTSLDVGSANSRSLPQRMDKAASMRSPALPSMPSFAASPPSSSLGTSKRLLVMSTPQKESAIKTFNMGQSSHYDQPKLVYPNSLVMESPTQEGSQLLGHRSRIAERCASFAGRSSFALNRSPSPVAIYSDPDD